MQMIQSEYRQVNKNSTLFADFGFVNGYKSSISKNKNSLSHLFAKFYSNLNLDNFRKSELNLKIEKFGLRQVLILMKKFFVQKHI